MKEMFLCRPCAEGAAVKRIRGGRDEKNTCALCGRRRYGDWYATEVREC